MHAVQPVLQVGHQRLWWYRVFKIDYLYVAKNEACILNFGEFSRTVYHYQLILVNEFHVFVYKPHF